MMYFLNNYEKKIYFASYATAKFIKNKYPEFKKIYLIGMSNFKEELEKVGLECLQTQEESKDNIFDMNKFPSMKVDENIDAVVVGLDIYIDYQKLCYASILLQMGKNFLASNPDGFDPMPQGIFPGNGSLVEALKIASGKQPEIIGKPFTSQVDTYIIDKKLDPVKDKEKILIIGDRLDTDISLGNNANIDTALVLTGVSKIEDVQISQKVGGPIPTYILDSLKI